MYLPLILRVYLRKIACVLAELFCFPSSVGNLSDSHHKDRENVPLTCIGWVGWEYLKGEGAGHLLCENQAMLGPVGQKQKFEDEDSPFTAGRPLCGSRAQSWTHDKIIASSEKKQWYISLIMICLSAHPMSGHDPHHAHLGAHHHSPGWPPPHHGRHPCCERVRAPWLEPHCPGFEPQI